MSKIVIPRPDKVLELDKIPLQFLEKIFNYSLHARLVLEGLIHSSKGIQQLQEEIESDVYNSVVLSYIFEIGNNWLNVERRRRFDQLLLKLIMYPDFNEISEVNSKSVYVNFETLWSTIDTWSVRNKVKMDGVWKLESGFQEWPKFMFNLKKDDYLENNSNYANLVARVLIWYMNYLQHPFSIYHILLLSDIDESLRTDVSRYVKKMVKSRDSIDSIDSKFEKLTKDYDSNVEKYGKVQRGHYPLKYVKVESDGTCVISEWNQPKYTKRKKNFFSSNTTLKNKSSEQNFDREDLEDNNRKDSDTENQRYRKDLDSKSEDREDREREDREREDREREDREDREREDSELEDRKEIEDRKEGDQKPDQETNRETTD